MDSNRGLAASVAALGVLVATALTLLVASGTPLDFSDWPSSPRPQVGPEARDGHGGDPAPSGGAAPALVQLGGRAARLADASRPGSGGDAPRLGVDARPRFRRVNLVSPRERPGRRPFSRGRRISAPLDGGPQPAPQPPTPELAPQPPAPSPQRPAPASPPVGEPVPSRELTPARPQEETPKEDWHDKGKGRRPTSRTPPSYEGPARPREGRGGVSTPASPPTPAPPAPARPGEGDDRD